MSRIEQERIEELARLLDGEVTERASSEAQKLLVLASAVRDNAPELVRPTPAFRAELRHQLIEEVAQAQVGLLDRVRDAVWERTARWRHSAKVATASATASLMIGTAGAAAAAQSALPGDLLYPLKQATESVRLALAGSPEQTARLQLALAEERMEEIDAGLTELTATQLIDALARMDEHTEAGAEDLLAVFDAAPSQALLDELRGFTTRQRSELSSVVGDLPLEAVPFADRSLELLRRIDVQAALSAAACDCGLDAAVEGATRAATSTLGDIVAPGTGPAAPGCTDCDPQDASPAPRDTGLLGTTTGTDGTAPSDDGLDTSDPGGVTDGTTVGDTLDGVTSTVTEPLDTLSEQDGTLTDPVGTVTEPIDSVTDPVGDTVDDTVDTVGGDDLGGTVDGTVDDLGDTVDEITTPVQDPVDEVGDLLP